MVALFRRKAGSTSRRLGRRGALLLLLGFIYTLVGVNLVLQSHDKALQETYWFQLSVFPSLAFWGGVFVIAGVLGALSGFWQTGRDAWGFMILTAIAIVWACSGALTAIHGNARGALVFLSYAAISGVLLIVSGMKGIRDE